MNSPLRIGIVAATYWEMRGFISAMGLKRTGDRSYVVGGTEQFLSVEISGIGKKNARRACERILSSLKERGGSSLLISSGFACALKAGIYAGDLVLDEERSDPQFSAALLKTVRGSGVRNYSGRIWTSDRLLVGRQDKEKIAGETGALAAEMESRAICDLCKERSVPVLSFRTISDTLNQDLPRSASFLDSSGKIGKKFWRTFLLSPGDWYGMARLTLSSRRAEKSLTKVLLNFIKEISQ